MRRVITACAVALCLGAVSLAASDDHATIKSKEKVKAENGKVITATGCLTGAGPSYTLAHATTVEKKVTVGTSGTIVEYTIVPRGDVDLTSHVGQMVEVTGVMIPATNKNDKTTKIKVKDEAKTDVEHAPDAKEHSQTTAEVPRTNVPQLAVTSVKMVGASCIVQ